MKRKARGIYPKNVMEKDGIIHLSVTLSQRHRMLCYQTDTLCWQMVPPVYFQLLYRCSIFDYKYTNGKKNYHKYHLIPVCESYHHYIIMHLKNKHLSKNFTQNSPVSHLSFDRYGLRYPERHSCALSENTENTKILN